MFSKIQHTPTFDRGPVSSSFWFSFGSARPARLSLSLRRHRSLAPIPVPPPVSPAIRKIHHLCHTVMHLWVPTSFLFFFAVEVTAIAFKFQIANDASIRFEVLRVWIDIRFSLLSPALSQQPSGSRLILCWNYSMYSTREIVCLERHGDLSLHETTFACHDPVGLTAFSCSRSKTMKDCFIGLHWPRFLRQGTYGRVPCRIIGHEGIGNFQACRKHFIQGHQNRSCLRIVGYPE